MAIRSGRQQADDGCDIFVAPPGFGKSVLANTINLGLCLGSAAQVGTGAKLPLIGKLDIGPSAEGFISLLQEALPPERRGEAVYVPFQFIPAHAFNVFDLQVGCRQPLPLERAFLQNFLSLASMPINSDTPFESMDQMVSFVIDEAYRMLGDSGPNTRPKRYQAGIEPAVDAAIARLGVTLEAEAWWWEVVDALCQAGLYHLAGLAQRHAVPVMEDLITAARSRQVQDTFGKVEAETRETATEMFVRYVKAFVRKYPTLNMPTRLDFGPARVIVLDLEAVAPTGSAEADRQTELMSCSAAMCWRAIFSCARNTRSTCPSRARLSCAAVQRDLRDRRSGSTMTNSIARGVAGSPAPRWIWTGARVESTTRTSR